MRNNAAYAKKVLLENKYLRVEMLPEFGGKITSLFDKATTTEFLLQPTRDYIHATQETPFEESDRSGWDECLPTVSATSDLPDHGDLWRQSWRFEYADHGIHHFCDCFSCPLRLSRHLYVEGFALWASYTFENLSDHPVDFLWSAHPLLAVSPGDRIVLSSSIDRVRVNSSRTQRLSGETIPWPISGDSDLSVVGERDVATADKVFVASSPTRACGLYRTTQHVGLLFRLFPKDAIRYTGLWLCYGGWPESAVGTSAAQYAVAIEATTSPCDSLDQAIAEGTAIRVGAYASVDWTMQVTIVHAPLDHFTELSNQER